MVEIKGAYGTSRGIDNLTIGIAGFILLLLMGMFVFCLNLISKLKPYLKSLSLKVS